MPVTVIKDVLEEHFEELQILLEQRQANLRSPLRTLRHLQELDERIETHVQGLLIGDDETIHLLCDGLASDDLSVIFASAYTLLRFGTRDEAIRVIEAFRVARPSQYDSFCQALCHGPIIPIISELQLMLASSPPGIDVRAAEILAFHGFHDLGPARLESFLIDPNPYVRQVGWRITSRINIPLSRKIYEEGMQDKDLDVRREAMFAAGWNRNGWLLDYCRRLAASPSSEHYDAYLLLAVLGKADDLDLMCKLGSSKDLGAERLRLLGAFGHPAVIEPLIFFMRDGELRLMITAGEAFEKITGENILSLERVQLLPEDGHEPDEFEREFLDEAFLPDPNKAQAYWNKVKSPYHKGLRWCRGSDIGEGFNRETADLLDLESRWEAYFRAAFRGEVNESPLKLVS